jgi:DNA-binding NarL/FixJ family response regulator
VVLCDLVLGGTDRGADLCRFKERAPGTLVMVMTAFEEPERIFRALLAGADGYLWKSDHERTLAQTIREVSAAGFPLSRGVAQVIRRHLAEQGALSRRFAFGLLSARHRQIVDLICEGYKNGEIAGRFNTTEDAIKAECKEICGRLGVRNRASAAAAFAQFVRAFTVRRPAP